MTLPEETRMPSPSMESGDPGTPYDESKHQWDINDTNLPTIREHDEYQDLPDSHCKYIYLEESEEARRHTSGWAMRNTNNHNVNILKKSCLGVLVCNLRCTLDNGGVVSQRPAICDKARKKQIGKACPNPRCEGRLEIQACRGHCGYPVTHFWRHVEGYIFFQAKGVHDHPKPESKNSTDSKRSYREGRASLYSRRTKRPLSDSQPSYPAAKMQRLNQSTDLSPLVITPATKSMICSCPPFECVCRVMPSHNISQPCPQPQPTVPQPSYNNSCAYSSHTTAMDSRTNINNFHFSPEWKESYEQYFDFSGQQAVSGSHQIYKQTSHQTDYSNYDLMNMKGYSTEFSPSVFLNTDATLLSGVPSKVDNSVSSSCMYYQSQQSVSQLSPHSTHNSSSSDSGIMSMCSQLSPTDSLDNSLRAIKNEFAKQTEFDMTHPADILSLDQPIQKTVSAHSPTSGKDDRATLTSSLMSALLPSINAFLDEDNQKQNSLINNTNFTDFLLSPSNGCTRNRSELGSPSSAQSTTSPHRVAVTSPHSLTELQPISSSVSHKDPRSACAIKSSEQRQYSTDQFGMYPYDIIMDKDHTLPQVAYQDSLTHPEFDSFSFYNGDIYNSNPHMANLVNCS